MRLDHSSEFHTTFNLLKQPSPGTTSIMFVSRCSLKGKHTRIIFFFFFFFELTQTLGNGTTRNKKHKSKNAKKK